jgi:Tfp pilus assembly protein PilO
MDFDKRAVIKIALVALTIILGLGLIPWQIKLFFDLKKNIKKAREEITKIQDDVNTKPKIIIDTENIKNEIAQLNGQIISYQEISSLQAYISQTAKENSIEIVETGSAPPTPYQTIGATRYISIPITLSLKCNFHALGKFIAQIESSEYSIKLKSLTIAGGAINSHTINLGLLALAKET